MMVDLIMSVCYAVLSCALIPQVINNMRNHRCGVLLKTSLITAIALTVVFACMLIVELFLSAAITMITALLWWVLVLQRINYRGENE